LCSSVNSLTLARPRPSASSAATPATGARSNAAARTKPLPFMTRSPKRNRVANGYRSQDGRSLRQRNVEEFRKVFFAIAGPSRRCEEEGRKSARGIDCAGRLRAGKQRERCKPVEKLVQHDVELHPRQPRA